LFKLEVTWFNSPRRAAQTEYSAFLFKQKIYSESLGRLIVQKQLGFLPPTPTASPALPGLVKCLAHSCAELLWVLCTRSGFCAAGSCLHVTNILEVCLC